MSAGFENYKYLGRKKLPEYSLKLKKHWFDG
jgi:hypothetical protein